MSGVGCRECHGRLSRGSQNSCKGIMWYYRLPDMHGRPVSLEACCRRTTCLACRPPSSQSKVIHRTLFGTAFEASRVYTDPARSVFQPGFAEARASLVGRLLPAKLKEASVPQPQLRPRPCLLPFKSFLQEIRNSEDLRTQKWFSQSLE